MARIALDHVDKVYANGFVAARDLSLEVHDGELLVLVGPSGSGKSTVLRMMAGLEMVTAGKILIGDRDVTDLPPQQRDIAMVFQNYALYPHMTVRENLGFGLAIRKQAPAKIAQRVNTVAASLGLDSLLDRKPAQLSGGQRQRVALGRAIVREPLAFLFDEPLSNLDAGLRAQMRIEIGGLQRRLNTTTVYVTHDQVEAMTLGDRIVVLADGRIQQIGRPIELYLSPVNRFVAGFIGTPAMNFIQGRIEQSNGAATFVTEGAQVKIDKRALASSGSADPITLGIRPEDLNVEFGSNGSKHSDDAILGKIVLVERLGGTSHIHFEVGSNRLMASVVSESLPSVGENISVRIPAARAHLFAADGKAL